MLFRPYVRIAAAWLVLVAMTAPIPPLFPAPAQAQVSPALPQTHLDTTYAPPSGNTLTVPAGGDFQAALNNANPGDTIRLAAGAAYTGPFTLRNKSGAGWIYIVSSALSSLPGPGNRVAPTQAAAMPKLWGPGGSPAIRTDQNAHNYRFVGIEFAPAPGAVQHDLVYIGSGGGAWNFVLDRCYIHGDPNVGGTLWGLRADASSFGLVDSYLANFRDTAFESHAFTSISGAGPFKLENNYLDSAGQSVMFGGQDPNVSGLISSDIEIRGNYMTKRLSWKIGDPTYAGTPWIVKNVLELKNAQRVLIDGNIFENNWRQADQDGFAIIFTPRNQNGGAPWAIVQDVTFTHNIVRHTENGVMVHGTDNNNPSQNTRRVLIQNNLFYDIGAFSDRPLQWFPPGLLIGMDTGSSQGVALDHNTAFVTASPAQANSTQNGFEFTNNLSDGNAINLGNFPGLVFTHNVLLGGTLSLYPLGNWFPPGTTPVVNAFYGGADYHLVPGSPYKNAGTDSKDVGADVDAVNAATANATSGTSSGTPAPPPPPPPPPAAT